MKPPYTGRPAFEPFPIDRFGFGRGVITPELDPILRTMRQDMRLHEDREEEDPDSLWADISRNCKAYIDVFAAGSQDDCRLVVSTLFATALTHGFQQGHVIALRMRADDAGRKQYAAAILDRFVRLAEALGVRDVTSREHGQTRLDAGDLGNLLSRVEDHVGYDLSPPRTDGALFGIELPQGIFTDRHFDGIYAAWRLKTLTKERGLDAPSILEIGGGAGYVGYYAWKMGMHDYSIIDLPAASIVQYLVLASDYGIGNVAIGSQGNRIKLLQSHEVEALDFGAYDIVLNIDSLPEMPLQVASGYLRGITKSAGFLSINQESAVPNGATDQIVVRQLCAALGMRPVYRFPSWLRTGYVEEYYQPR